MWGVCGGGCGEFVVAGGGRWIVDLFYFIFLLRTKKIKNKKIAIENICKHNFDTKILFLNTVS